MINDEESLHGATTRFGNSIRIWDDGFGDLWVYRNSMGVKGIVRAEAWEDAFSCVVDEIMDDADSSDPCNRIDSEGNLPEGVLFRGNGVPSQKGLESNLAADDINGSSLDKLTPILLAELEITLDISK